MAIAGLLFGLGLQASAWTVERLSPAVQHYTNQYNASVSFAIYGNNVYVTVPVVVNNGYNCLNPYKYNAQVKATPQGTRLDVAVAGFCTTPPHGYSITTSAQINLALGQVTFYYP
jgi:hypothetical protein